MSVTTSPEFLINMKRVPVKGDSDYEAFIQHEIEKLNYGITINGVFISNWLYWHLNYWKAYIPQQDERTGEVRDLFLHPELRDNEWILAEHLEQAKKEKKGLIIIGGRRIAKTTFVSSWLALHASIYQGSQNVIVGNNKGDIRNITLQMDKGLSAVPPLIKFERILNNWGSEVELGYKESRAGGDRLSWSNIYVKNTEDGINTEVLAGLTPKSLVYDEIGKAPIKEAFIAGIPALESSFGWRCVPILTGCVCAGTKVWNNKGELINIEDIHPDNGIIGFDILKQSFSKEIITYWQSPHIKKCYRLITNTERVLECSEDHPIYTQHRFACGGISHNFSFKEVKDLVIGDNIGILDSLDLWGYKTTFDSRLVGWLIGDGTYGNNQSVRLCNADSDIWNYIENNYITRLETEPTQTKDGRILYKKRILGLRNKLRLIGIYGQTKENKRLPNNIHSYTKKDVSELLGGYFDADGCCYFKNKSGGFIKLSSVSIHLLKDTQLILQKFGVHANINYCKPNFKNPKTTRGHYDLIIKDKDSILSFYNNIKFSIKYKQENLDNLFSFLQHIKSKRRKQHTGLRLEKIKKIEYIGEKPVYNLTTGITHTYIANGIITHNTGGDFTKGKDAEEIFYNPERYNLVAVQVPNENRKTGLFLPGNYAVNYIKIPKTLTEYTKTKEGSELDNITINITDFDLSNRMIDEELERASKAKDQKEYLKIKMYKPRNVDECFLSNIDSNPFPVEALKQHYDFLNRRDKQPKYVKLYHDPATYEVKWTHSNLKPITEYPVKKDTIKDAPVVIYEEPIRNPPAYLYIAGIDPYNQDQSVNSPSLGTIYIYKRTYDPVAGTYQRRLVASYSARPEHMKEWHEMALMLLELYGATGMTENIGTNFIQFMENQNKAHLLADGYSLAKEISPQSTAMVGKMKGLPATSSVQNHYKNLDIQYLNEEVVTGNNPVTGEPIKILGLTRIDDPMLILEHINYREEEFKKGGGSKKKGNFDRYVAWGHVLTYDEYLQKIAPNVRFVEESEPNDKPTPKIHSPFLQNSSTFTQNRIKSPFLR